MEPDVPFALLAIAQLLAVAAFAGIALAATVGRRRSAWTVFPVVGGIAVAVAEAITAADLGTSTSTGVGWVRAGGALALLVASIGPATQPVALSVAPLAAGVAPGWTAAVAFAASGIVTARRGRGGGWMFSTGMLLTGAAAALSSEADTSGSWATTVLVLRAVGSAAVLGHLGLLARRSVLTKVVGAILGAVTLTAVAATSVVGTTVADRLSQQQSDRVRAAAVAEVAELDQAGLQASVFAQGLADATSDATRAVGAAVYGQLCSGGTTFVAQVSKSTVTDYPDSACGQTADQVPAFVLSDLANQLPVTGTMAAGGKKSQGFVVLQGQRPVVARISVARPTNAQARAVSTVQVYGIVLDHVLLQARKTSTGFDATVITPDGQVAATTLSASAAAQLATDSRTLAAAQHPPAEHTATVNVSTGNAPTVGYVSLIDGPNTSALLVLSAPAEAVSGVQRTVLKVLVVAVVLIGLLVALLGLVLGQRIAGPIRQLTAAMEAVRRGDLTARTSVRSGDEVGALATTFDAMTVSLAEADEVVRATAAIELATRVRLETVLASMTDGLVVSDPSGTVTSINPAAAALLGDDAVGQALTAVVRGSGPDGKPLVGTARSAEGMLFRRSGPPVAVAVASSPLSDGQGSVLLIRDMTRERQVEQMKTEFLSNVSHELRTPLTPIQGYADILSRRPDLGPDKVSQYSAVIYDSTKRLSRIVDLLVDVASLDAGRVVPEASDVDLRAFLDRRLDAWRASQPARATDLRKRLSAGLPAAHVDAIWLAKAVDELVDNALKFSDAGKAVTLSAGVDEATGLLRVSVKDGGRGLDAAARAALFSDFEQGDGSATRVRDGLGLGLSFVRRVADVVGVTLQVESAGTGKGSTFSLLVPTAAAPVGRPRASRSRART